MAEIERWITVNGNHIPVMKGESKMAAVGRFIKGKRKDVSNKRRALHRKWDELEDVLHKADQEEDWKTYDEYSKDYNKAAQAAKDFDAKHPQRDIKGYSDDPYNRVEKARKARAEAYNYFSEPVKRYNDEYEDLQHGEKYDANRKNIDKLWDRYAGAKTTKEKLFYKNQIEIENARYENKKANVRKNLDEAEADRTIQSALAMQHEAIRKYNGYKLKGNIKSNNSNKHSVGDSWSVKEGSKTLYKVQFPKGIMTFTTKREAQKWIDELNKKK